MVTDNNPSPGLVGTLPSGGTSGYISNLTVQNQGSGYTLTPGVSFTGGGGSDATATASITLTGGAVTSINVDQPGSGYTTVPTVEITGDGQGATATAQISLTGGGVTTITITNGGSGYNPLNLPAITFGGGGGQGAAATAIVTDGVVTGANISNPGSGYSEAPTVTIAPSAPPNQGATNWAPDSSFVSGGGSTTSVSLNQTTRALTAVSDNLPQPALYGNFPNANNTNGITGRPITTPGSTVVVETLLMIHLCCLQQNLVLVWHLMVFNCVTIHTVLILTCLMVLVVQLDIHSTLSSTLRSLVLTMVVVPLILMVRTTTTMLSSFSILGKVLLQHIQSQSPPLSII